MYLLFVALVENFQERAQVLDANDFITGVPTASRRMDVLAYGAVDSKDDQ